MLLDPTLEARKLRPDTNMNTDFDFDFENLISLLYQHWLVGGAGDRLWLSYIKS